MNFSGIWPGIIENTADPNKECRVQVRVPQVYGPEEDGIPSLDLPWARPCMPFVGKSSGIAVVPEIGAGVWVMFVGGDPRLPVWLGGWYGTSDKVADHVSGYQPDPKKFVLRTPLGHKMSFKDGPAPGIDVSSVGTFTETVASNYQQTVGGTKTEQVTGGYTVDTSGFLSITAALGIAITSLLALTLAVAGAFTITTGAALTITAGAAFTLNAVGTLKLLSNQVILGVEADKQKLCNKAMMDLYNTHTHDYTVPAHPSGSAPTGSPNEMAMVDTHTTTHVEAS